MHKDAIKITILEQLSNDSMEVLVFRIDLHPQCSWRGALVYRPPGPLWNFALQLLELIFSHAISTKNFFLLGDCNVHSKDTLNQDASSLLTDLRTLDLNKINEGPTHSAGHTLDLILTKSSNVQCGATSPLTWTEHSLIEFKLRGPRAHDAQSSTFMNWRRWWHKIPPDNFQDLIPTSWNLDTENTEAGLAQYKSIITTVIDHLAPQKAMHKLSQAHSVSLVFFQP